MVESSVERLLHWPAEVEQRRVILRAMALERERRDHPHAPSLAKPSPPRGAAGDASRRAAAARKDAAAREPLIERRLLGRRDAALAPTLAAAALPAAAVNADDSPGRLIRRRRAALEAEVARLSDGRARRRDLGPERPLAVACAALASVESAKRERILAELAAADGILAPRDGGTADGRAPSATAAAFDDACPFRPAIAAESERLVRERRAAAALAPSNGGAAGGADPHGRLHAEPTAAYAARREAERAALLAPPPPPSGPASNAALRVVSRLLAAGDEQRARAAAREADARAAARATSERAPRDALSARSRHLVTLLDERTGTSAAERLLQPRARAPPAAPPPPPPTERALAERADDARRDARASLGRGLPELRRAVRAWVERRRALASGSLPPPPLPAEYTFAPAMLNRRAARASARCGEGGPSLGLAASRAEGAVDQADGTRSGPASVAARSTAWRAHLDEVLRDERESAAAWRAAAEASLPFRPDTISRSHARARAQLQRGGPPPPPPPAGGGGGSGGGGGGGGGALPAAAAAREGLQRASGGGSGERAAAGGGALRARVPPPPLEPACVDAHGVCRWAYPAHGAEEQALLDLAHADARAREEARADGAAAACGEGWAPDRGPGARCQSPRCDAPPISGTDVPRDRGRGHDGDGDGGGGGGGGLVQRVAWDSPFVTLQQPAAVAAADDGVEAVREAHDRRIPTRAPLPPRVAAPPDAGGGVADGGGRRAPAPSPPRQPAAGREAGEAIDTVAETATFEAETTPQPPYALARHAAWAWAPPQQGGLPPSPLRAAPAPPSPARLPATLSADGRARALSAEPHGSARAAAHGHAAAVPHPGAEAEAAESAAMSAAASWFARESWGEPHAVAEHAIAGASALSPPAATHRGAHTWAQPQDERPEPRTPGTDPFNRLDRRFADTYGLPRPALGL
ncbi:hypothetical protein KFE25_013060 [Diacronema lutheri]|uniref:Uncharacterized protein n=1 Tax=Diacronema lutheri TaxID=2081491 RepID=A0A8J5XEU9_DIALT|nr:hypothetical protein KFE25_013060 [Diacronema lutheri]